MASLPTGDITKLPPTSPFDVASGKSAVSQSLETTGMLRSFVILDCEYVFIAVYVCVHVCMHEQVRGRVATCIAMLRII